jgi:FkbM family methyltransferase
MRVHEAGLLNSIGKRLAQPLSAVATARWSRGFVRLAETYLAMLQGKGSGGRWSLDSEFRAARLAIGAMAVDPNSELVLFDVGANVGEWSLAMSRDFPGARIFMFEPQPNCQAAVRALKIPNATLIPKAVSSHAGTTSLYTSGPRAGIASLHSRRDSYFQSKNFDKISVETVALDDVIEGHGLACVNLVKMDIEGHEFEGLKGAMRSLEKGTIKAFTFEFGSGNVNSRTYFHDFWDLVVPLGYRLHRIVPSGRLLPITDYYEDCEYFRGVSNYLAVSSEFGQTFSCYSRT